MLSRAGIGLHILQRIQSNAECLVSCQFQQSIRWRKRRWAPVSAAKMYFVPEKPVADPEEKKELKRRKDNYNTYTRALYSYFREQLKMEIAEKTSLAAMRQEAQELRELVEINNQWNEETGRKREAYIAKQDEAIENSRLEMMVQLEQAEKLRLQEAKAKVERAMELSKNFITLDNLEMEIEKTLNTKVNYNFSIDLKGNKYLEMPDGSTVHDKEFSKDKQEKQSQASNS